MNLVQKQFYALYEDDMPESVTLVGQEYRRVETFKYDFFAATGLYRCGDDPVVVKIYRRRRFFGLPMRWSGRLMARHEERLYRLLEKVEGIADFRGFVGRTGFAHSYIPGRQLHRSDRVDDLFFDRLERTLRHVHIRGAAYMDLDKAENVLIGEDGRPHLIDFQISYAPKSRLPGIKQLANFVLRQVQTEDRYHFAKHKRRMRPDLLSPADYAKTYQRSLPIRLHRWLTKPYFAVRHLAMDLLDLKAAE